MEILVDVDNLFIVHNRVNTRLLVKRIRALQKMAAKKPIHWFGNTLTATIVQAQPELQDINIITTNKAKDTADHAILSHLHMSPVKTAWIVSNDKALAKAAWYISPHVAIVPVSYKSYDSITPIIQKKLTHISFHTQSELEKFLLSIHGYAQRYGNISVEKLRGARK